MKKRTIVIPVILLIFSLLYPYSVPAVGVGGSSVTAGSSEPVIIEDKVVFIDGQENLVIHDENGDVLSRSAKRSSSVRKTAASLPSSYDARSASHVTSVKNQGNYGTCWAHAAIASIESQLICDYGQSTSLDLSEDHLIWFSDVKQPTLGDGVSSATFTYYPYSGGRWERTVAALANWWGVDTESNSPYPTGNYAESKRTASSYRLRQAVLLADTHDDLLSHLSEIKQAVIDNGAVQVSYYSHKNYYSGDYTNYYMSDTSYKDIVNHAVTIVGWNDSYSKSNFRNTPSGNGAFLIKNSWGADWGSNGFFWISYYDYSLSNAVSFECVPVSLSDHQHVYGYNGHSSLYASHYNNKTTLKYANAFVSPRAETLDSVGLWVMQDNIDYTISVYRGLSSSAADPTTGTLVSGSTTSGNAAHAGYYTVKLKSGVGLQANERYAVVVSITAKSHDYMMIPFELYGGTEDCGEDGTKTIVFSSNRGESYICPGSLWYDVKDYSSYEFNNAYLNVYTKSDTTRPSASISATNNVAVSQTATLSLSDDAGLAGYYWGTAPSYQNNSWFSVSGASASIEKTISSEGTYYLTAKDSSGNLSPTVSKTFHKTILNADGGSVLPPSVITASGSSFILPIPMRNGYTFKNWNTKADGSGASFSAGAAYPVNAGATLYAQWTVDSYTATIAHVCRGFNGKGTGNDKNTITLATTTKTFTCDSGLSFMEDDLIARSELPNGVEYDPYIGSSDFSGAWEQYDYPRSFDNVAKNVHIEAGYRLIDYSITYDTDGGTLGELNPETYNVVFGAKFINEPVRPGYTFAGWTIDGETVTGVNEAALDDSAFADNAGLEGGAFHEAVKNRTAGNITVKAKWIADPPVVTSVNDVAVVDREKHLIYGIPYGVVETASDLVSKGFISIKNGTLEYEFSNASHVLGTGTKVKAYDIDRQLVDTYTVVIFGDVDGDGRYDGTDAFIVSLITAGALTETDIGTAAWMAADCDHDGTIDAADRVLLERAGLLLAAVDQSRAQEELLETNSAYVEYLSLIDQSAGTQALEDDTDTDPASSGTDDPTQPEEETQTVVSSRFAKLLQLFEKFFGIFMSIFFLK